MTHQPDPRASPPTLDLRGCLLVLATLLVPLLCFFGPPLLLAFLSWKLGGRVFAIVVPVVLFAAFPLLFELMPESKASKKRKAVDAATRDLELWTAARLASNRPAPRQPPSRSPVWSPLLIPGAFSLPAAFGGLLIYPFLQGGPLPALLAALSAPFALIWLLPWLPLAVKVGAAVGVVYPLLTALPPAFRRTRLRYVLRRTLPRRATRDDLGRLLARQGWHIAKLAPSAPSMEGDIIVSSGQERIDLFEDDLGLIVRWRVWTAVDWL